MTRNDPWLAMRLSPALKRYSIRSSVLPLTLATTAVLGFLESAGGPRLALYWVFPMFGVFMALALPYVAWPYR